MARGTCLLHSETKKRNPQLYITLPFDYFSFIHSFCGGLYPRLGKSVCVREQQKIVTSGGCRRIMPFDYFDSQHCLVRLPPPHRTHIHTHVCVAALPPPKASIRMAVHHEEGAPPPPGPLGPPCVTFRTGALDSHPLCPSHVASGRCVLSAAAAGAPAGVVSAFAEPSRWCAGAVLNVAGCAVCASAAPNNWPGPLGTPPPHSRPK